jgi:hypothetical protein
MNQALIDSIRKDLDALHVNDGVKSVYAPFETLGADMVSRLPSVQGEILVVSDAGLLVAVLQRLRRERLPFDKVRFLCHTEPLQNFGSQLGVRTTLVCYNQLNDLFKKADMGLKFDVVVGNPPYQPAQEGGKTFSGAKLWPQFIELANKLTKDGGVFSLITPQGWLRPSRINRSYKAVFGQEVLMVSCGIDGSVFGSGASIMVGYFVVRKGPKADTYVLRIADGTESIAKNDGVTLLPNMAFKNVDHGILSKTINSGLPKLQLENDFYLAKHGFSKVPTQSAKFPAYLEANRVVYIEKPHASAVEKLIVFRILKRAKHLLVLQTRMDSDHSIIADHGIHPYIVAKPDIELVHVEAYLQSKLVRYLISLFSASAHMPLEVLRLLPTIRFDQAVSDEELFKKFKLTKDEISRVLEVVK